MSQTAEVSRGAWVRKTDTTYGSNRFPFGMCRDCHNPACHEVPANDNGDRLVCMAHKPPELFFVPFLGQQTKIFTATERWVLAGGGAGGSKTYAGARLWLKQWRGEQARYLQAKREGKEFISKGHALFLRRTIPQLITTNVVAEFKAYYKKVDPGAHWNQQDKCCTFSNGYKVQFGGCEDEDSYLNYIGGEFTLIVFDEATQFTEEQIKQLDSRLRCSDPVLSAQVQLYLLTNPVGGATKAWLRRRYVKRAPPETRIKIKVKLADGRVHVAYQIYIPSNLFDNPALVGDGVYEANLMLKGAAMRRALLLNDWDVDEGCWVGDDWNPAFHVVDPHPIPASWPKFKMADWGTAKRASFMWGAMDPDGGLVIYRAWSCVRRTSAYAAAEIKRIESTPLTWKNPATGKLTKVVGVEWDDGNDVSTVYGPMDAACWAKMGHELSIGDVFEAKGCGFSRSEKGTAVKHAAGDRIRARLQHRYPDHTGTRDLAGLRFFRGTTETTIKNEKGEDIVTGPIHSIPLLAFDPNDPDLPDTSGDDHDWDALAYGETSRPAPDDTEREDAQIIDFVSFKDRGRTSAGDDGQKIAW